MDSEFVGEECTKIGLTASKLNAGEPIGIEKKKITEAVIVELEIYRRRTKKPLITTGKWMRLLLGDRCKKKSDRGLTKRADDMRKRYKGNAKEKFKTTVFEFAHERSNEQTQAEAYANLKQANLKLKKMKKTLKNQLTKNQAKLRKLDMAHSLTLSRLRQKDKQITTLKSSMKAREKYHKKREGMLNKRATELNNCEVRFRPYNVKRRFETVKKNLSSLKDQNIKLNKDLCTMKKKVSLLNANIRCLKRSLNAKDFQLTKQRQKIKSLRRTVVSLKSRTLNFQHNSNTKQLNKKLAGCRLEIKHLRSDLYLMAHELNMLRTENKPLLKTGLNTREFSNDVKLAYMSMASLGVSARRMSAVAECILNSIGRFNISIDDLPKEWYCRERFKDCNSASTIQVAEELSETKYATLHSDGTSRDGNKVIGFQITTDKGTRTLGLLDVHSGDSETQLEAFNFIMNKLGDVLSNDDSSLAAKQLVSKIKNTMGDQAATQKSFNGKLETYRKGILPDIQEHWDDLDEETKIQLGCMNHFFCNLHTLIGAATYCDAAMKELESTWRSKFGQLGVEKLKKFQDKDGKYSWKHTDSAIQRLIRTTSDAVAPGGDQKSGCISGFRNYKIINNITSVKIVPFRANRFNVLFSNAAAIFYHRNHIKDMFLNGWVKAENKLLQAVLADIQSEQLLAGVRALGILHKQLTEPFWQLTENKEVHILQLGQTLQSVYNKLVAWSVNATPLLDKNLPCIFTVHDPDLSMQPIRDEVFDELYANQSDHFHELTKDVLQAQCTHLQILFKRRHSDQIEGGKYSGQMPDQLLQETKNMKKSNKVGENDLGYWAHIMERAPSLGVMAAEGKMAFRRNFTSQYLQDLQKNNPLKFTTVMKRIGEVTRKWKKHYTERTKQNTQIKTDAMLSAKALHDKQKQRREKLARERYLYIKKTGECKSPEDVDKLVDNQSSKTSKLEALRKHSTYLKNKYNLMKQCPISLKEKLAFSTPQEKNSLEKLKSNLKAILTFLMSNNLQPMENEEDKESSDEEMSNEANLDTDDDSDEEMETIEAEVEVSHYEKWNLADTIAVAFEDNWYIAVVGEILNNNIATVNWLKRFPRGKWGWPTVKVEQASDIDRRFVIASGLDLIPDASMRYLSLPAEMIEIIQKKYNAYYNKYFAPNF